MHVGAQDDQIDNHRPSLDWLLRFDPKTEAIYEVEYGRERARHLSVMILMGLLFYNCYNFTSVALLPDILWLSIFLRLAVVTPGSIALSFVVLRVSGPVREFLVTLGIIGATVVPIYLFYASAAPLSSYSFLELPLSIYFGVAVLALRFRYALAYIVVTLLLVFLALMNKAGLDPQLQNALYLQFATACAFTLTANFVWERRRCQAFIKTLTARQVALEKIHENAALRELTLTDPLTQLANRRHFEAVAEQWLEEDRSVSLLILDVDYFKRYNDALGHVAGDRCLINVAGVIGALAQKGRILAARIGGEEFVLFCSGLSEVDTETLGREVLHQMRSVGLPHPSRKDGVDIVTVSIGGAMRAQGESVSLSSLLSRADEAMYRVKMDGRNGFLMHRPSDKVA